MLHPLALKRTTIGTLASAGLFALSSLLLPTPAHAVQLIPSIGETVTQVTDTVQDVAGGVGQTVTDTGAKVGDAVTDTGAAVGDKVGGPAGDAVKQTTGAVGSAVKDTSANVGSLVNKTTEQLTEGNAGTRVINKILGDAGAAIDDATGKGATKGAGDKNGVPTTVFRVPDRLDRSVAVSPLSIRPNPIRDPGTRPAGATSESSTLVDAVRRALEAAKRFVFPLALTLLVVAYLGAHGWFDRRDPKLALAAVDPDADLLRFE